MISIAILGAGGFIGNRAVESFHLNGEFQVRPIVRRIAGHLLPARFDLDVKTADAFELESLARAFSGCEVVVDLVLGDPRTIVETAPIVYQAACTAGVRRLIYMSSQAVHGQAPAPGTTEASIISTAQPLPYNSAKVRAERRLTRQREQGSTELVILRPGIVLGPRSRWISVLADQLLSNSAYLIGDGSGICNSIYVDNLIEAIRLCTTAPSADKQTFLVGDKETVSWADLYSTIATALGIDPEQIPRIPAPLFQRNLKDMAEGARTSTAFRSLMPFVPATFKRTVKAALGALAQPRSNSAWSAGEHCPISPTLEMTLLQQCSTKLSHDKASALLGYEPIVSFPEGCSRSIAWLQFAGYPVSIGKEKATLSAKHNPVSP